MRILLLNQFFWPDSSATSQLLTDVARQMAANGHEVFAISSAGAGYALAANDSRPDVRVRYIKALPFKRGAIGRILSYLSFYVSAAVTGLTLPKPDLVVTLTTPPLLSLLGTVVKSARGSRHYIWEMDVYPDVAVDLNYVRAGGWMDRLIGALADLSRKRADGIVALGDCMKDRLVRRGISADKISVAHNWADGSAIQPVPRPSGNGQLTLLYSGNLGLAHDLDTILGAMRALRTDERFRFLFVGSGGRREELEAICRKDDLHAAEFRPFVQRVSLERAWEPGTSG